jgi:hypothetical protein
MSGDCHHGHAISMAIKEPIDQVQIAGSTASGTHSELAGQLRLRAGGKCRDLFMSDGNPVNLAAYAQRLGYAIERITHQSINAPHVGGFERLNYSVCNIGHLKSPLCVPRPAVQKVTAI